jgi:hypothetical protein
MPSLSGRGRGDPTVIDPVDPIETALTVGRVLEALDIPYTVGGSIASSFAGEPRATVDIDVVAEIDEAHVDALVSALSATFYVDAGALRRAVRARSSANLIHQATCSLREAHPSTGARSPAVWPWTSAKVVVCTCILPRTSCSRNSAGIASEARCRTDSGVISPRSSACRVRSSSGSTCAKERASSASRIFSSVLCPKARPNASDAPSGGQDVTGSADLTTERV